MYIKKLGIFLPSLYNALRILLCPATLLPSYTCFWMSGGRGQGGRAALPGCRTRSPEGQVSESAGAALPGSRTHAEEAAPPWGRGQAA